MPKTMLIDAYHPEETRVALLQGGKVEDFDFEYASRKPLRGNIYLARVTRVEPSLQAAFIEYGGNRHGFLAFGEIHPDYYQIPVADREVLRKAEALEVELAQKLAELNSGDDDDDGIDPDDDDELRGRSAAEADQSDEDTPEEDTPAAEAADETHSDTATVEASDASSAEDTEGSEADDASEQASDYVGANEAEEGGDWHAADETLISAIGDASSDGETTSETDDAPSEEEEEEDDKRVDEDETEAQALVAEDDAVHSDEAAAAAGDDAPVIEAVAEGETLSDEPAATGEADPSEDHPDSEIEDETGDAEARVQEDDASEDEVEAADEEPPAEPNEDELAAKARQKEIDQLRSRYEEAKRDRNRLLRAYKIQEVIKRRQIMLVQVVKEERGNKGAALTTYLSLAGRYGVLMPNTARGGGISRKITSQSDRRRLKKAMSELDIAPNQGLIIRTAGAKRSKVEIKRDYDYLSRLWEQIRKQTMDSVAPSLIYEEANLMKRAIRDLYDKDTEQVIVQGDDGYREAKDFMKMLMPSHAKYVQRHKSDVPVFQKHRVEEQLDGMYQPTVQLKSGGYIVIQQTEALVSIDVNSGKATKERNVEQTALKTNSEAAAEVARQCRLRDLAGLIVVDFIDMEENRNNRSVEKKLKDAMKNDRARTQIGSISSFGLLEMSRQRRRSGIVDGTTQICPVCDGAGHVRSHEMAALRILRAAEGEAGGGKHGLVTVKASTEVALYILNTKRAWLERMENLYGVKTNILADSSKYGDQYEVSGSGSPSEAVSLKDTIGEDGPLADFDAPELPGETAPTTTSTTTTTQDEEKEDGEGKPKRRRRRRRRKGSSEERAEENEQSTDEAASEQSEGDTVEAKEESGEAKKEAGEASSDSEEDEDGEGKPKRRRRRGRRGGRRNRRGADEGAENAADGEEASEESSIADAAADEASESTQTTAEAGAATDTDEETDASQEEAQTEPEMDGEAPEEHKDMTAEVPETTEPEAAPSEPEASPKPEPTPAAASIHAPVETATPKGPRKGGWWQRAFKKD